MTLSLPKSQDSYWLEGRLTARFPALQEDIDCDVVIIGGGISGLNTAFLLKKAGLKVVVLEKNTVGSGTSGGTTGKVTTQHGLIYAQLAEKWGRKVARQYGQASQAAFDKTLEIIQTHSIDCEWTTADNYVYTADPANIKKFRQEAKAAAAVGLPASFETSLDLPFDTTAAVKFSSQARFHVQKYLLALANLIQGQGSYIFENSNATHIKDGTQCKVTTTHGSVTSKHIVVATKVPAGPLAARGLYAVTEYPVTSYIVAGKYTGNLKGMYISPDKEHYSLLPTDTPKGQLLLVGGESHIPGLGRPTKRHQKLADYGQKWFGLDKVDYRWKAMDYIAYDSLPLAGPVYPWSKNMYTIGGLKKWGLNLSMVGASVVSDLIIDKNSPLGELFSPHRLSSPASIPSSIENYFK